MRTPYDDRTWASAARWTSAIALIAVAHAAGAWYIVNRPPVAAETEGAPPAIMIDLAPVAVSQDAEQLDLADGQLSMAVQADPKPVEEQEQPEEVVEEPEPAEEVIEEPPEPEEAEPLPEEIEAESEPEEVEADPLPDNETAEVTLPETVPFPTARPKWLEDRPTTTTQNKRPKPRPKVTRPVVRNSDATAPVASDARKDQVTASPSQGTAHSPSISPARWNSRLSAHLNRYKRFPSGASTGIVQVRFTIDAAGRITGIRLAGRSGDGALDQAALDLIRRANPVPAPPAELLRGGSLSLTVPINYTR